MRSNLKKLAMTVLFAAAIGEGKAGPVGPLTTFTAGTQAKASEVNGNFGAVSAAVNDNDSRITAIESRVSPAGNVVLTPSTATTGNVLKGATRFIHNFGLNNTFIGTEAGNFAMTSNSNTGVGVFALQSNATGGGNTATGAGALLSNTAGFLNTAVGLSALANNTIGVRNIAVGATAGGLTDGSDNIDIGNIGVASESGVIRIGTFGSHGTTFIAGIRGVTTAGAAVPVLIDVNGQLGTASSSRRVKEDIADMGEASGAMMKLRPVTFHYKSDKEHTLHYGLVAEEVAEVAPGLVARSADGRIETVYYQFLVPMLLNEVQKQQRTIEAQAKELARQSARVAELYARLERAGLVAASGR